MSSAFKRVLIPYSAIDRLRVIRDEITKHTGLFWAFHARRLLDLVAEALRIIADIVDQANVGGGSDGLTP